MAGEAVVSDDGAVVDDAGAVDAEEADAATGAGSIPDSVGCAAMRWIGCVDGASVADVADVVADDEASAGELDAVEAAEADATTGAGSIPAAVGCCAAMR